MTRLRQAYIKVLLKSGICFGLTFIKEIKRNLTEQSLQQRTIYSQLPCLPIRLIISFLCLRILFSSLLDQMDLWITTVPSSFLSIPGICKPILEQLIFLNVSTIWQLIAFNQIKDLLFVFGGISPLWKVLFFTTRIRYRHILSILFTMSALA